MDDSPTVAVSNVSLLVNGRACQLSIRHHGTLLDVLRDELELTGAKRACDRGECSAPFSWRETLFIPVNYWRCR